MATPILTIENIQDLTKSTLAHNRKKQLTQIATKFQDYIFTRQFLNKNSLMIGGGKRFEFRALVDLGGRSSRVGLYATDTLKQGNHLEEANVPWRHLTDNWSFDLREDDFNSGAEEIVSMIDARETAMLLRMIETVEEDGWDCPVDSTDVVQAYGIAYWIFSQPESTDTSYSGVHATGGAGGFLAKNKTGFTNGPGNMSAVTYPKWGCWNHQYVDISPDDAVDKLITAMFKTNFKSPIQMRELRFGKMRRFVYTTHANTKAMGKLARQQNDKVGNDLAQYDGDTVIKGIPFVAVPQLEDIRSDNPFIGIDWSFFKFLIKKGWFFRQFAPKGVDDQHTVVVNHRDLTWNTCCFNRRGQFILTT